MTEGDHVNKRGSYAAFWEETCEEFLQRLIFYGRRLERKANVCDAEDLIGIAVDRLIVRGPDPSTVKSPLSYFFRTMHNAWADEVKKRSKMDSLDDPNTKGTLEKGLLVNPRVQQILETKECLDGFVLPGSLTDEETELFNLLRKGETAEEIAIARGEHPDHTKVCIHRLIAKLHARVKAEAKRSGRSPTASIFE